MTKERTFIIIKPDAIERGLAGPIIERYCDAGLDVEVARFTHAKRHVVEEHYAEHRGKPFYSRVVASLLDGPVMFAVISGPEGTVSKVREMNGATDPAQAAPGTIRGDFGTELPRNVVHASDSIEAASREIELWFGSQS
jgi:nucleoside-diphosphate kinase